VEPSAISMQFAVQAFNVFNHVQLGDPGSPGSPALSLVYEPTATTTGFLTAPGGFWGHQYNRKLQQQQRQQGFPEYRHRPAAAASVHGSLPVLTMELCLQANFRHFQ
jgi:hypothetical protein